IEWLEKVGAADPAAVALLEPDIAVRLRAVPIRFDGLRIVVAMIDPTDIASVDEIAALTGRPATRIGLEPAAFAELMKANYGTTAARMAESLANDGGVAGETEHNLDAIEADDVH